jgi:glycosyltransferase involved in cell wall biosynthesis
LKNNNVIFYIVAPPYITQSAGIRVLHLLCHLINAQEGCLAFIAYQPGTGHWKIKNYTNPSLHTPFLAAKEIKQHKKNGLLPIVIYPEVVWGNPYQATRVARYLLNFPGLLGGPVNYQNTDFIFSYDKHIHVASLNSQYELFIPSLNRENFWFKGDEDREVTCFYASKYQKLGGKVKGLPEGAVEITRGKKDSLSQKEVGNLLRKSKVIYIFENTHLIYEAIMCGCPAVIVFNEYFKEIIAEDHFSLNGIAFSDSKESLQNAVSEIPLAIKKYENLEKNVSEQIKVFIEKLKSFEFDWSKNVLWHPFYSPLKWPYLIGWVFPSKVMIKLNNLLRCRLK